LRRCPILPDPAAIMNPESQTGAPLKLSFKLDRLGSVPVTVAIHADAPVRKALAEFFDILGVETVAGSLSVRRWRKHGALVEGVVTARITQECVVTLAPVVIDVREEIRVSYLPEALARPVKNADNAIFVDPLAEDPPEPFDGHTIDLGALVTEYLALGISPYPRADGASVPEKFSPTEPEPEEKRNVFQALARWRERPEN